MNLQETIELLKALKEAGATHFKSHELEVTLIGGQPEIKSSVVPTNTPFAQPAVPPSVPAIDPIATQKAQDLIDLLKLKDEDLVNKIFPDGAM